MNDFRRDLVERAFIILDKGNRGYVDTHTMKQLYNPRRHPDVLAGKKSEHTALQDFMDTFD